jgi:hypothetical protein
MSRSRYAALPLLLGLFAGTASCLDLTGLDDICLNSEGCDGGDDWGVNFSFPLSFSGSVTSAPAGQALAGVTVRVDAPARGWSETVLTDSTGRYVTNGLPQPGPGDCAGLSVSFSREGFQPLQVTSFPTLTCGPGFPQLDVALMPTP